MARRKGKGDGGEALLQSFNEMCERLAFMNEVLEENKSHLPKNKVEFVIKNALSIEEEWVLDPTMRSNYPNDDYLEHFND